ncbi:hypothetical protein [Rhodopseudomonas pseudopalustris]|uniref:Mu-like prophage FluMu N-terminal domain-containing protein n=1 Tax=Rhodopseudomonas pseudopalustris TaxID=1513892 RepID=A0A1H8V8T4_9BRAD|nr:hypothetical protein [Rhodopseudomonas pseudopalustris]SEP11799.1 hypothetical protein SAMN05444123_108128 [Rhodopseudomonas pseudopalustris]
MAKKPKADAVADAAAKAEADRLAAEAQAQAAAQAEAARIAAAQAEADAKLQADADRIAAEAAADGSTHAVVTTIGDQTAGVLVTKAAAKAGAEFGPPAIWVKSKSERGRRRAGFAFTREPTLIFLENLHGPGELEAILSDPELIVTKANDTAG